MLITMIVWLLMFFTFAMLGMASKKIIRACFNYSVRQFSSCIVLGIVGCTIYAEAWSIFAGVNILALLSLVVIDGVIAWICRKNIVNIFTGLRDCIHKSPWKTGCLIIGGSLVLLLAALVGSMRPEGYDTFNYHMQAIRWMEEYGIVKGLGNLHTRFAYNSSSLCLQALFSLSWINGFPIFPVNSFVWAFSVIYCVRNFKFIKYREICLSDLLRLLFLVLLFASEELVMIASTNTDFLPMCLIAYTFICWAELNETGEKNYVPYGLLVILGLFTTSTKLSAAIMVFLIIKPLADMLKQKKYVDIFKFVGIGFLVLLPFVVRNVIISGYLVYPVASIDIFNFDWEMPKAVVMSDSFVINEASGGWKSIGNILSIKELLSWLLVWLGSMDSLYQIIGIFDLVVSVGVLVVCVIALLHRQYLKSYDWILPAMSAVGFLFWFVSAPSLRFGKWWVLSLPLISVYLLLFGQREIHASEQISTKPVDFLRLSSFCLFISINMFFFVGHAISTNQSLNIAVLPNHYYEDGSDSTSTVISDYTFFYYKDENGVSGRMNGYAGFPGTECLETLQRIELRGNTLGDGFRIKEEFTNVPFGFQGNLLDEAFVEKIGAKKYYN